MDPFTPGFVAMEQFDVLAHDARVCARRFVLHLSLNTDPGLIHRNHHSRNTAQHNNHALLLQGLVGPPPQQAAPRCDQEHPSQLASLDGPLERANSHCLWAPLWHSQLAAFGQPFCHWRTAPHNLGRQVVFLGNVCSYDRVPRATNSHAFQHQYNWRRWSLYSNWG